MAEYKGEPSIDGWKVGDKCFYNEFGKIRETAVLWANDNLDDICDFDMFMIKHGYAKRTSEEVRFQIERDAVLYELSKFAEPKDRKWNGSNKHWCMCWNYSKKEVKLDADYSWKHNNIYFATEEDAEKAIQAVGEERVKKYYLGVED